VPPEIVGDQPKTFVKISMLLRSICPKATSKEIVKTMEEYFPEELEGFRKWLRKDPDIWVLEEDR
jgi:hypothetical protein